MKICMLNADIELQRTFDSITSDYAQWKGWSCIHLKDPDLQILRVAKEILMDMEMQLYVYLKNIDGALFMAGFEDIYLFCKNTDQGYLKKLSSNVCELINPENAMSVMVDIYNLSTQRDAFEANVVKTSCLYNPLSSALYYFDKKDQTYGIDTHLADNTRALVVEDDPSMRWTFRKNLKGQCMIETAQGVSSAFKAYKQERPDIIFLDLNLPDGSGYAVLEWILRNDPEAYIVVCSSRDDEASKEKAMSFGAKAYLTKPFTRDALLDHIAACADTDLCMPA